MAAAPALPAAPGNAAAAGELALPAAPGDAAAADGDLFLSCMVGDQEGAALALARGASPNYINEHGITPLLVLCGGVGPAAFVAALLAAGAQANLCDASGWSPLIYVASSGQMPLLELLLAAGAAVDHASAEGWTPLTRAAHRGQTAVVARLLALGASVHARKDGATALELAEAGGHGEAAALLRAAAAQAGQGR